MWIIANIDWILTVSGAATCSMIVMALAPRLSMRFLFGEEAVGAVAQLIVRSWGAMIAASGLMLIYAASHAEARLPILLYSVVGKLGFVALVAAEPHVRRAPAMVVAIGDLAIIVLLAWYLLATWQVNLAS